MPETTANRYAVLYKSGLMPELAFKNDEMPSDDCFKTLSAICDILLKKSPASITKFLINSILTLPYSEVEEARHIIERFFCNHKQDIDALYKENEKVYFLLCEGAEYLCRMITSYIADQDKAWEVFAKAVTVGIYQAELRLDAVFEAVGEERAPEIIYASAVNGWLLHPRDTDPAEAIKYLMTMFDAQTICKILLEQPAYLNLYKEDGFAESSEERERREREIQEILQAYK